jgi:hypothetical protein
MSLVFGPDDEGAYFAARDELIAEFRARTTDPEGSGDHADTLLDFKWGYADGDLGTWRSEHLEEFLMSWMPRKVLLADDMVDGVVPDVRAFLTFLADTGRLTSRSDPLPRLLAVADELGAGLPARMSDPAHWSMGKALTSAMAADGVDATDQAQLDAWTEQFNARPFHEREALTGGPRPEPAPEIDDEPLTARHRPDPDAVATVAARAPILGSMLKLSEYLGDGRPLTKKGNLKLADARALVERLETGDLLEETVGDRTYTPRSAEDIRGLDTIVEWAKGARVVRIVKGSMLGTASFRKLARDPVAGLDRLVDTLFEVGPLAMHRPWASPAFEVLDFFTDAAIHSMVMSAYELDDPLEFEVLVTRTVEMAARRFSFPEWMDDDFLERHLRHDLADAFAGLEQAGVVRHEGYTESETRFGSTRVVGGSISLTPYGVATVQRLAADWGFDAPVLEPFDAAPDGEPVVLMRALDQQLASGGPAALVQAFDSLGPSGGELLATGWRVDDGAVIPVLEALGRHHLDKPTARTARKAVIQHRSWRANLG